MNFSEMCFNVANNHMNSKFILSGIYLPSIAKKHTPKPNKQKPNQANKNPKNLQKPEKRRGDFNVSSIT